MPRLFRLPPMRRMRRSRMLALLILLSVIIVFVTPFYVIYKPPGYLISYFQRRWPDVLFRVDTQRKIVALTIDDAPSQHTPEILAALAASNAKATFFVIGSQVDGDASAKTLQQMVSAGHELGNHAMHDEPSHVLSDQVLTQQLEQVQVKIDAAYVAAGVALPKQRFFRPGSGIFSSRMRTLLSHLNYKLILGSVYPHDAQISWWRANAAHILSMVRPGSVIVCHDRRSWTPAMLRTVLPELRRRGYEIVTTSELLEAAATENQPPQNEVGLDQ